MDVGKGRARAAALSRTGALDGAASVGLNKLAGLARFIAGAQYAAVHLLDDTTQYRVAEAGGLALVRDGVAGSMCLPVVEAEAVFNVEDATEDPRFEGNPNTTGENPVRFFAAAPLRDDGGVAIGTLCVFGYERQELDEERVKLLEDLATHVSEHLELHSLVQRLGHSATHDALTGLPNRSLLSERLAHAMTRRKRHPGELALAVIDLDGFKAINDTYGHQVGDALLVLVAERLLSAVREEDTVARLGGDEFVVLYEQLPLEDVDDVADALKGRLLDALRGSHTVQGLDLPVSASVGFVRSAPDELGFELLGRADAEMYAQKAGRDGTTARAAKPA